MSCMFPLLIGCWVLWFFGGFEGRFGFLGGFCFLGMIAGGLPLGMGLWMLFTWGWEPPRLEALACPGGSSPLGFRFTRGGFTGTRTPFPDGGALCPMGLLCGLGLPVMWPLGGFNKFELSMVGLELDFVSFELLSDIELVTLSLCMPG